MERHKKDKKQGRKVPRVPIKTYKWEDVRRSRKKGGYPWTYLYKQPFNEEIDPEEFTMDAMRKSKSASTLGKTDSIQIEEIISSGDSRSCMTDDIEDDHNVVIITEEVNDSNNHSISKNKCTGSFVIEEQLETGEKSEEPEFLNLESAESSDNISQYLDKEERLTDKTTNSPEKNSGKTQNLPTTSSDDNNKERAKSEEPQKKRKLSVDSSHSRMSSISRLGIVKKLKEAKEKIKFPKLTLSTPNLFKIFSKNEDENKENKQSNKEEIKETEQKKEKEEVKKTKTSSKKPGNVKPVYVHIPLKLPPGQTDEFSYLEFEDKKKPEEKSETIPKPQEESESKKNETKPVDLSPIPTNDLLQPRPSIDNPDEIVAIEIVKSETINLDDSRKDSEDIDDHEHLDNDIFIIEPGPGNEINEDVIIILSDSDQPKLSRQASKKLAQSLRKRRAKSAEPERKRKTSIESSYSRISLPKGGLLKKLKDAKDKFKFPKFNLKKTDSQKSKKSDDKKQDETGNKKDDKKEDRKKEDVNKKIDKPKGDEPKYIHIPLKPPPGQTDEFSHLEFQSKENTKPETIREDSQEGQTSPIESPGQGNGVQFIFLTPPSDDEILDKSPDIPETPSSDTSSFFEHRVEDLKELARGAVDKISPETKRKKLEPVTEESNSDKIKIEEIVEGEPKSVELIEEEKKTEEIKLEEVEERMIVDEEDGLKLSESAIAKQEQIAKSKADNKEESQELKSSLKGEGSPVLKKKVSFKKKNKPSNTTKDGSYEDIQVKTEEKPINSEKEDTKSKLPVLGTSQSMSVDEEKTYLDDNKIIKSASLEEDYNKWSKLSDHEYEPINPPPDEKSTLPISPPTVRITDTDLESRQNPKSSPISLVQNIKDGKYEGNDYPQEQTYIAQNLQTEIEDKYFNTPPTDTILKTSEISSSTSDKSDKKKSKNTNEKQNESPGKFQRAIKAQTEKFRDKIHSFKKPNIKLPNRPKITRPTMQKFKIDKPKFHLPKIPDTTRINLPTFSLPRKSKTTTTTTTTKTTKRTLKERQLSTESNAGDSKKKFFDFSTYPRIFKKKPKNDFGDIKIEQETTVEFATVPRTKRTKEDLRKSKETDQWEDRDNIRIPLHAEDSIDQDVIDSIDQRIASHIGYDDDIDNDDAAYEKENQEIHRVSPFSNDYNTRWNHGSFHPEPNQEEMNHNIKNREYQVTDLDSPEDCPTTHDSFDTNASKDIHSSESSLGIHRRGVLEEIDSDEFFLRQKGISQDNIEVGMYLSSEIREAFKQPINSLLQMQHDQEKLDYIDKASTESIPETPSKRKSNLKKPKRKKTPHVSQEQISGYDQDDDSEPEEYSIESLPPPRPKRRSKKNTKNHEQEFIPYQETIPVRDNLGILNPSEDEQGREYKLMYENQQMEGKEQPEINVIDPYKNIKYEQGYDSNEDDMMSYEPNDEPLPPPRKHRSLKSLSDDQHIDNEYVIPTPEGPPSKPPRTRGSIQSLDRQEYKSTNEEVPVRPTRSYSRTRSESCGPSLQDDDQFSRDEDLSVSDNQVPCVEEPCQQLICDYMGYAVVDKSKIRDPPLPPPRPIPRQRRSVSSGQSSTSELRFSTVPRSSSEKNPPVRPLRNYSTLGPSRPPRRKQAPNMTDEEKENVDITQYIEIEGEPNRDLNSGEVIQKMRDRPLPAPPRPPRKSPRTLQDITTDDNMLLESNKNDADKSQILDETEVSTQTEPLPDDFVCEEVVQEPSDKILEPSKQTKSEPNVSLNIERHLITPTHYTHEETVTHGTLLVQPLDGAKILPDSEFTRIEKPNERIIPVEREFDDEETSEIPEYFKKLKDPEPVQTPQIIERIIERPVTVTVDSNTEVDVLKAQKLQVSDLDVDKLTVNELLAHKIIVSEIDSSNIQTNEVASKSGTLKIGEIELPPSVIQQIIDKINANPPVPPQSTEQTEAKSESSTSKEVEESTDSGQKKTPIEQNFLENESLPQRPPRKINENLIASEIELENIESEKPFDTQTNSLNQLETEEIQKIADSQQPQITSQAPDPPKRQESCLQSEEIQQIEQELIQQLAEEASLPPQRPPRQSKEEHNISEDLEVDDEPPPRPPQPPIDYIPSQPPASFYALKAQKYAENFDENIPTVPRRKRHQRPPISRSSSEDNCPVVIPSRRRYRSPEPTIPELTGQLIHACGTATNNSIRRLIAHITNNVLNNTDGKQDLHVMIIILLVLIAGLILLGYGDEKTVHYHHWEYFNPPRDM